MEKQEEKKPLGLYISVGILDILTLIGMVVLFIVFLIFYNYIDGLMQVAGISSLAGLIYGSIGYVVLAIAILLFSIPFGVSILVLDIKLFIRLKIVKRDGMTWLLIINTIVSAVAIHFLLIVIMAFFGLISFA